MSIAKKKSRKIVVDGTAYRYSISGGPIKWACNMSEHGVDPLVMAIELYDDPKSVCVLTIDPLTEEISGCDPIYVQRRSIYPKECVELIRNSISDGWNPEKPGNYKKSLGEFKIKNEGLNNRQWHDQIREQQPRLTKQSRY